MPDFENQPRARRHRRRWLWRGFLLLCASILVLGIFPNQTLNPLVAWIAPKAARSAGWNLELGGLAGAPWKEWRVTELRLTPEGDGASLREVRFEELRLSVDSGFWTSPDVEHLEEIWGRGGFVDWHQRPSDSPGDASTSGAEPEWNPGDWPRVDLDDCVVRVQGPGLLPVELAGLRVGLKETAGQSASRTVSIKVRQATRDLADGSTESSSFDAVLNLLGKQLGVQDCTWIREGSGKLSLGAQLDLSLLSRPIGTFELRSSEWPLAEIGTLNARAEGELKADGVYLIELDARTVRSSTLRLEKVHLPWTDFGADWQHTWLPGVEGDVVLDGSDLEVWLKNFGGETAPSGQAWPLGSYRLEATISQGLVQVQQARVTLEHADWPAPLMVSAKGPVALDETRAEETDISGLVSVGEGRWTHQTRAVIEWPAIHGDFAFQGAWSTGKGHIEWHPSDLLWSAPDQPDVRMNGSGRIEMDRGQLLLRTLLARFGTPDQGTELPGEIQVRGELPTLESLIADYQHAPFTLQADLVLDRLAPLRTLLPSLRMVEGRARGQVAITGNLADPSLRGSVECTADSVRFIQGEVFRDVVAHMEWKESASGDFDLNGQYGGAPVQVLGRLARQNGQTLWSAKVNATGFPLWRSPDARIRADADLRVEGSGQKFDVQGDVYLTHGRLHRDFDLAGSLLAAVDGLAGSSRSKSRGNDRGQSLEFPFPAGSSMQVGLHTRTPLDLISDLGRSSIEVEGLLIGRAGRMYPEGTIVLNGGRISLPGSTLAWKQGVVLLPKGGGPPTIEALGTTRLSGHDISLRIHGPLNDPLLDLNSTPQRADYDLLILLLTGELPQGRDWSRTTESLSLYLAKDVLKRWLGSDGGDGDGLFDRFEFNMGREVSESGLGTLEAMFRLKGEVSGQGKGLWITAERDRFEDVNFGLRFVLRPR